MGLRTCSVVPIDHSRGRFLELVARMTKPKRVLEIGPGGIKECTKIIFKDRRLKSLIVPLGDGLSLSYRVA